MSDIGKWAIAYCTDAGEYAFVTNDQGGLFFNDTEEAISRCELVMVQEGGGDAGDKFYLMNVDGIFQTQMILKEIESNHE